MAFAPANVIQFLYDSDGNVARADSWPSDGAPASYDSGATDLYVAPFAGQTNLELGQGFQGNDVQIILATSTGSSKSYFYGWSPSKGIGLINSSGGIKFDIDIWDESLAVAFSSKVSSAGTFFYNNNLGSASNYVNQGVFIGGGASDGTSYYYNSQQAESFTEYNFPSPNKEEPISRLAPFTPFTGYDFEFPQGNLFYSNGSTKGNNFYVTNGVGGVDQILSNNSTNGQQYEFPIVVETGDTQQGFLVISTNLTESGVDLYYNGEPGSTDVLSALVLQLPESTSTEKQYVSQLFYLNANDRSSALVATAAVDPSNTSNIFNRQLRFYPSFSDPKSFDPDFISTELLVEEYSGPLLYTNYYDTFVAYRTDGNYFEWQPASGGNGSQGEFVNIGDFSTDIDFYGDLLFATPTIDGSGIFFGYKGGTLQFYNGTYSYYIPTPIEGSILAELIPYDEKSVVATMYNKDFSDFNDRDNLVWYYDYLDEDESTVTLSSTLTVNGTKYNKVLEGTSNKDFIVGSSQNDFFNSNSETSRDKITGNGGRDTYLFTRDDLAPKLDGERSSYVKITDFGADDTIAISRHALAYQKDVTLKIVSSGREKRIASREGFNIIFNDKNGRLFFNHGSFSGEKHDLALIALLGDPGFGFSDSNLCVV